MNATLDRIDIHAHAFPEVFLRKIAAYYPETVKLREPAREDERLVAYWAGAPLPAWDSERRLREMERDRVAVEILSAPTIYSRLDEHTVELCALLNDFQAEAVAACPERFRSFLHLPVHDVDAVARELARWQGHPEIAGVVFGSNMGGRYPGEAIFERVWETIHEAKLPVFIHPVTPGACFGPAVPTIVLFPCDTTVAAASMIYGGLFERYADLRVILSHYGGTLPFLARRLDMAIDIPGFPPGHGQDLPSLPSSYVSRFYLDAAQGFHRPAFECARSLVGIERMLYGSDHFFTASTWRQRLNEFIDELELSADDRRALLEGNARRLLPCF